MINKDSYTDEDQYDALMEKTRLPKSFHRSFSLEINHLSQLINYVDGGLIGTKEQISSKTGIPTGKSTGKVIPTISYASAMGILYYETSKGEEAGSPIYRMYLTEFGKTLVREYDTQLNTPVSQWAAHLNICRRKCGADLWYKLFTTVRDALPPKFKLDELKAALDSKATITADSKALNRSQVTPTIQMYHHLQSTVTKDTEANNIAVLKECQALSNVSGGDNSDMFEFKSAPMNNDLVRTYGAWLLTLIEQHFTNLEQVMLSDLQKITKFNKIAGWSENQTLNALDKIAAKGLISLDKHMTPWLVTPLKKADEAWKEIYNDLV